MEYQVTKPKDLKNINVNDFGELLWWSYLLQVTPEKLLVTIEKVGSSADLVQKAIKQ